MPNLLPTNRPFPVPISHANLSTKQLGRTRVSRHLLGVSDVGSDEEKKVGDDLSFGLASYAANHASWMSQMGSWRSSRTQSRSSGHYPAAWAYGRNRDAAPSQCYVPQWLS